jgi:hypothetical protein
MAQTFGSLLLRAGAIRPEQLTAAHALKAREGGSFGECLVRMGVMTEEGLVEFYHKRLMIPRLDESRLQDLPAKVLSLVTPDMAAEFRVVPVEIDREGTLTLAMADPSDNHAVDEVAFFADKFVVRGVASESAVRRAIERHYRVKFAAPALPPTSSRSAAQAAAQAPRVVAAPPPAVGAPPPAVATAPHAIATAPHAIAPAAVAAPARAVAGPPHAVAASGTITTPPTVAAAPSTASARPAAVAEQEPSVAATAEPVVLLTKIKRSDETPLPMPLPPDDDAPDVLGEGTPDQPILLTRPVVFGTKRDKRDTLRGIGTVAPDPPLEAVRQAQERDEVVRLALNYVGPLVGRACFFVARRSLLVGHDARGIDPQIVRRIALDIAAPSLFRDVVASRLPYRGPLPDTSANEAFAHALGGVEGDVLCMPIAIRERIIAVIFADGLRHPMPEAELHALTREAGLTYERLILSHKTGR